MVHKPLHLIFPGGFVERKQGFSEKCSETISAQTQKPCEVFMAATFRNCASWQFLLGSSSCQTYIIRAPCFFLFEPRRNKEGCITDGT